MQEICEQAKRAAELLCEQAKLRAGELVVVGCSTSEICGSRIGTDSQPEVAETVFRAIYDVLQAHGVELAAQCCRVMTVEEHCIHGGLGGAVAEYLCQHKPVPMKILGLPNESLYSGTSEEMKRYYHLDCEGILASAREFMK